jgi:hypothetical protein
MAQAILLMSMGQDVFPYQHPNPGSKPSGFLTPCLATINVYRRSDQSDNYLSDSWVTGIYRPDVLDRVLSHICARSRNVPQKSVQFKIYQLFTSGNFYVIFWAHIR